MDFTPEMLAKARENARKLGYDNVEFRQGDIEALPLTSGMVDVVVSNCVLNLVPDKRKAFAETLRVLRPGGHFSISDVVLRGEIPTALRESADMYAGCVSGAMQESSYLGIIHDLGFAQVTVQKRKPIVLPDDILEKYLTIEGRAAYKSTGAGIFSITVAATKPTSSAEEICCAPNAEGTAKIRTATREPCGCDSKSTCC